MRAINCARGQPLITGRGGDWGPTQAVEWPNEPHSDQSRCPAGWRPAADQCVQLHAQPAQYDGAMEECARLGAELVNVVKQSQVSTETHRTAHGLGEGQNTPNRQGCRPPTSSELLPESRDRTFGFGAQFSAVLLTAPMGFVKSFPTVPRPRSCQVDRALTADLEELLAEAGAAAGAWLVGGLDDALADPQLAYDLWLTTNRIMEKRSAERKVLALERHAGAGFQLGSVPAERPLAFVCALLPLSRRRLLYQQAFLPRGEFHAVGF